MPNSQRLKVWDSAPVEWQKYDLCLVFPVDFYTHAIRDDAVVVIKRLAKSLGKKYLYIYYSKDGRRVYALIRAGLRFLRAKAMSEGWQLRLDEDLCRMLASQHQATAHFEDSLVIPHFSEVTYMGPYEYIYMNYQSEEAVEQLFQRANSMLHPFRKSLRLKMLIDFLTRNMKENSPSFLPVDLEHAVIAAGMTNGSDKAGSGQEYALNHLKAQGVILNAFAIPDIAERNDLAMKMLTIFPHLLPYEELHGYFGEKITLYYAFLDYLCRWMFVPAMLGVGIETSSLVFFDFSSHEMMVFSYFLMLYFITTLKYWKREQYFWALRWNTLGSTFEESLLTAKDIRPQYFGVRIRSYIDGKETIYYPDSKRYGWYVVSLLVLVFCVLLAWAAQAAVYYLRWQLSALDVISPQEQWIASGVTGAQIILCNYLYSAVAWRTTEWENHRLEVHFERALIVKTAMFQVCNVLATFYYLAFAARYVPKHNQPEAALGECGFDSCMLPLAINTLVIASMEVGWRWLSRFLWPYVSFHFLSSCCGMYAERRADDQAYNPYASILQNGAPPAFTHRDKVKESFYSKSAVVKVEHDEEWNMGAIYGDGDDNQQHYHNPSPALAKAPATSSSPSNPARKMPAAVPSMGSNDSFYNLHLSEQDLAPASPQSSPELQRGLSRNKSMMSERSNADNRSVVSSKDSPMRRQLAAAIVAEKNRKAGSSVVGSTLSSKASFILQPQAANANNANNTGNVEMSSVVLPPVTPPAASPANPVGNNNSANSNANSSSSTVGGSTSGKYANPMRANIAKYAVGNKSMMINNSAASSVPLEKISEEKEEEPEYDHKSDGIPSTAKPNMLHRRTESTFFNEDTENHIQDRPKDWQSYMNSQQSVKVVQRDGPEHSKSRTAFNHSLEDDETQLESAELGRSNSNNLTGAGGARKEQQAADSDDEGAQDYDVMNPFESFTTANYDYLQEGVDNYSQFIRILLITICFGSSLPAVFLIFMLYVWVEIRGQTWLLCFHYPRPLPESCEDLGVWMAVVQVVLAIGSFTNASIVILTMDQFKHWPIAYRLALWIGFAVSLLMYQFVLHKMYHGIPNEVMIQKQRALFLSTRLTSSSTAKATEEDRQVIATEML